MQLRTFVIALLATVLAVALFGCGPKESGPSTAPAAVGTAEEGIVAYVNGEPISRDQLGEAKESLIDYYQQIYSQFGQDIHAMLTGARGRVLDLNLEVDALERVFFDAIVDQEAEKRGIQPTEEQVATEFQEQYTEFLNYNNLTEEQLADYLQGQGSSLDRFKEDARKSVADQLTVQAVRNAVAGEVDLTDDQIEAYFEGNRDRYDTEEEVRASHILVNTEDEAQAILDELGGGADFATLAKERSTDTGSAANGGDLGWFKRGQMMKPFEDAAFSLQVGETSGIVETDYGYHIIRVTDRKEATHPELSAVIDQVRSDLKDEIVSERFRKWYDDAYANATISVADPLLTAIRTQQEDPDAGLAALERLKEEGSVDEPYLTFIIGFAYEKKMNDEIAQRQKLEDEGSDDPDVAAQIDQLSAAIEAARANALTAYEEALNQHVADEEIEGRITGLQPQIPSEGTP